MGIQRQLIIRWTRARVEIQRERQQESDEKRRGAERKRGRHGIQGYNQKSTAQNCRLGANSGLVGKTALNFPKTGETRPEEERERPKACHTLTAVAAVRLRLLPRLISPRSASISKSLAEVRPLPLFPSPPAIWAWNPPPLFLLRPLPPVAAPELP